MKQKLLSVLLSVILVFTFFVSGCDNTDNDNVQPISVTFETSYEVGIEVNLTPAVTNGYALKSPGGLVIMRGNAIIATDPVGNKYTFTEAGEYTVIYTAVKDGKEKTLTKKVTIVAASANDAPVIIGASTVQWFPDVATNAEFQIRRNNKTVLGLWYGSTKLTSPDDYQYTSISQLLEIKASYIETLPVGSHNFIFKTEGGECTVTVVVNSFMAMDYPIEFATNGEPSDHFFLKVTRTSETITFDFLTFGDFNDEVSSGLEFVNLYLDLPLADGTLNTHTNNWNVRAEDRTYRLYANGTAIMRDDYGDYSGADNLWWRYNHDGTYSYPAHLFEAASGNVHVLDNIDITRENGATSFSFELSVEELGLSDQHDFKFTVHEATDTSPAGDFGLYQNGFVFFGGVQQPDQVHPSAWMRVLANGATLTPALYTMYSTSALKFADDDFIATVTRGGNQASGGVTFTFLTFEEFNTDEDSLEFVNIYLDLPPQNNDDKDWYGSTEDYIYRIYSDGTVYSRTGFDGTENSLNWIINRETDNLYGNIKMVKSGCSTSFSLRLGYASDLGNVSLNNNIRFMLLQGSDNNGVTLYEGTTTLNGVEIANPARSNTWTVLTGTGNVVSADNIPPEMPEGYPLSFSSIGTGPNTWEPFQAKVTRDATGVTFSFASLGDFGLRGDEKEFINIYIDIIDTSAGATAVAPLSWALGTKDRNYRIYSDGTVVYRDDFVTGTTLTAANNTNWRDNGSGQYSVGNTTIAGNLKTLPNININKITGGGVTLNTFSLTLSYEHLGISADTEFGFFLRQCTDRGIDRDPRYEGMAISNNGNPINFYNIPEYAMTWPRLTADGTVSDSLMAQAGYNMRFGQDVVDTTVNVNNREYFLAKATRNATSITFSFTTGLSTFNGSIEFINIYMDLPNASGNFNNSSPNWHMNPEDFNCRIYGNGKVFYRNDFNTSADNLWWRRNADGITYKPHGNELAVKEDKSEAIALQTLNDIDVTATNILGDYSLISFSITLTYAQLGIDENSEVHFLLRQSYDNTWDYSLDGVNLMVNGVSLGDGANLTNWAKLLADGTVTRP